MRAIVWSLTLAFALAAAAEEPPRAFSWKETDTSLALLNHGRMVWQHVHDRKTGKPFMRLAMLDGTELTRPWPYPKNYARADHVWHKALWWSWKYIDGINFWEGNQEGTDPVKVEVSHQPNGAAHIEADIAYHLPKQPPIVTERRVIDVTTPNSEGSYGIRWQGTFTPAGDKDVVFNHNSYGGFAIRMAAEFCSDKRAGKTDWRFLKSKEPAKSQTARWMAYAGTAQNGKPVAIVIFSHPKNPRFPALWQTRNQYPYLNPSFTCKEDYTLRAGETLTLRYGVLVHCGPADPVAFEQAWQRYAGTLER